MLVIALTLALLPQSAPQPAAPVVPAVLGSGEYEIGPQDILRIGVYGHEDLNQVVVVQPDGTLSYPLLGRVQVKGLTPKALEEKLGKALAEGFIRNPQVSVVVQEYRSKVVFVVGEVSRPGSYPLSGGLNVIEVLARAGPLTPAAGSDIIVVRPSGAAAGPTLPEQAGSAEVITINVRDILGGNLGKNVQLKPNDTVYVPQSAKVFVTGEVRNPGGFPYVGGQTVRQLISLAGGITEDGSSGRIRVVRDVDGKAREVKIKLDDTVKPGDTIVVKARLF